MMTNLNMKHLSLASWMVLLLNAFSTVAGEDIFINPWQLRAPNLPYENLNATVGDTITFFWSLEEDHTVYINPSGNCSDVGGVLIGASSPASYSFTEFNASNTTVGNPVFFADNIDQLCEWGMRFSVEVFPEQALTAPPTVSPTISPSAVPSAGPTETKTDSPSASPIASPSSQPSSAPVAAPSSAPTAPLSPAPSASPTNSTDFPSESPSASPTDAPSPKPSVSPTTAEPSKAPTASPSSTPTATPVAVPTDPPTPGPTASPTASPTLSPTMPPTGLPTVAPTMNPTTPSPTMAVGPGDSVSETFSGLRMGMAGITNLTDEAIVEWQELTASFASSYVFNDLKGSVNNFETSFEVTDISPYELRRHQRMMRGEGQSSRHLQDQQEVVIVEYVQTVKYTTDDPSRYTPDLMITAPFATDSERSAYVALLKTSSNPVLAEIKGVSEIQVPARPTPAPTPAPVEKGPVLSKPAIIGIACGGAGLLILVVLFCIYCRSGADGDDKSGDPPLQVDVRNDEISTLGGPTGPPTYGDQSIATVDYDYSKAYGGAGDTSVSSAGGTFGSNTQNISFAANAGATGAALGSMDENSYDGPGGRGGTEQVIHIFAPPGKLGVVIDTPDDGAPVVHAVKDTSVIADRIIVGDKLVAVDDEDVRSMTAIKVSKMISRKGANPSRKLTIVRMVDR